MGSASFPQGIYAYLCPRTCAEGALRIAWRGKCAYSARVRACRAAVFWPREPAGRHSGPGGRTLPGICV